MKLQYRVQLWLSCVALLTAISGCDYLCEISGGQLPFCQPAGVNCTVSFVGDICPYTDVAQWTASYTTSNGTNETVAGDPPPDDIAIVGGMDANSDGKLDQVIIHVTGTDGFAYGPYLFQDIPAGTTLGITWADDGSSCGFYTLPTKPADRESQGDQPGDKFAVPEAVKPFVPPIGGCCGQGARAVPDRGAQE